MDRGGFLTLSAAFLCVLIGRVSGQEAGRAAAGGWQSLFDGKSLRGWKETAFPMPGKVRVDDGTIVLEKRYMTGITWTGSFPKSDFEVRFEAARLDGSDFFAGLTFPVADSHCSWIVGGWGGDVVGLSRVDSWDASQNVTTSHIQVENGRWYRLRLRVTAARIQAWIDDEQWIDVDLRKHWVDLRPGEIEASVPFGIATYGTTARLRNIEYRLLTPAETDAKSQ